MKLYLKLISLVVISFFLLNAQAADVATQSTWFSKPLGTTEKTIGTNTTLIPYVKVDSLSGTSDFNLLQIANTNPLTPGLLRLDLFSIANTNPSTPNLLHFDISNVGGTNPLTPGLLRLDLFSIANTNPSTPGLIIPSHGKTIKTVTGTVSVDTDIVSAVASKRIKVIYVKLTGVSATANTITFQSNASTALDTTILQSSAGVTNGVTSSIAAPSFLFATVAGEKLTLDVSAAQNVTYTVSYFDDDAS